MQLGRRQRDVLGRPHRVGPQACPQALRHGPVAVVTLAVYCRNVGAMAKWWTLVAVCVATFMLLLDITVVNVALPYIERDLKSSFEDLQWVIDAYALTLAAFLLTAGSVADEHRPPARVRRRPRGVHRRLAAVRPRRPRR